MRFAESDIDDLLSAWPRLRCAPSVRADIILIEGWLEFSLAPPELPCIQDRYSVRIEVPVGMTECVPEVFETGQRIPRDANHHVNSNGALCLGSPWRLRQLIGRNSCLVNLIDFCIVPFLYAATWREQGNEGYPFAELAHGRAGLLDDYSSMLGLVKPSSVLQALEALARRCREANKLPCPCGCGFRLGRCEYRFTLNRLRHGMARSSFRHLRDQFRLDYPTVPPPQKVIRKLRSSRID